MNSRKIANLLAYFAVALIAISLVVKYLTLNVFNLSSDIAYWCDQIAYYLACFTTIICAFSYASSRRNKMVMFFLVVAVIAIIVFTFVL